MKSEELIKELSRHPLVISSVAMQMQMGIPYLRKKNGRLCMSFRPHREEYADGMIEVYAQQYELEFAYPFRQVIHFDNFLYSKEPEVSEPVARIDGEWMLRRGKYILRELYEACDRVLKFQEMDGQVSDVSISKYQKTYWETVESLHLDALYGGGQT